jgi:hypothetical protein
LSDTPGDEWMETMREQVVVLDTQGPMVYIGRLVRITAHYLELCEADVHDSNDSRASKELYLAETKELGVRANRERVVVARGQVISMSRLEDVRA